MMMVLLGEVGAHRVGECRDGIGGCQIPRPYNRRTMMQDRDEGDLYLRTYPETRKWMNQCAACQCVGYKPELPDVTTRRTPEGEGATMIADNLRRYFAPLALDATGFCEMCSRLVATEGSD
jgi:hypothetical protein